MDWKELKRRWKWLDTKDPYSKPSKKDNYNFLAYKQSWWTRKTNIEWKDLWYQKQRKTTHKIHSLNNFVTRKESPNDALIRRTDDREGWKAMIADVCNRPCTRWWWWFQSDLKNWSETRGKWIISKFSPPRLKVTYSSCKIFLIWVICLWGKAGLPPVPERRICLPWYSNFTRTWRVKIQCHSLSKSISVIYHITAVKKWAWYATIIMSVP